jgi:O-antigen/teichoic acid export membrane protein
MTTDSREGKSVALPALKAALPLYAGHAVVVATGFVLKAALVGWVLDRKSWGRFTSLNELLQWTTAVGIFGLATGLQRLYPERVADRRALAKTAWLAAIGIAAAVVATIQFAPGLAHLLLGDAVAVRHFAPFSWQAPALAATAVTVAALHAAGRLRQKAALEASQRVAIAAGALVGGALAGFEGVLWGWFVGAVAVAAVVGPRGGAFERPLLGQLARIGHAQLVYVLLDTARFLVVLRVVATRAGEDWVAQRDYFATAAGFALPIVVVPELIAQALFPSMIGPAGEARGLDRTHRRLLLELAAAWLPLLALAGAAAAWLLPLARHGEYAGAVAPFLAILPGVAAQGLVAHTGYVVLVRDRLHEAAVAAGVALAVAAGAAWALVPRYGATGAGAALSAALIVRSAMLVVSARRGRRAGPHAAPASLDEVRKSADPQSFPTDAVAGAHSAACFFAAAFHGRNDALFLADAGVADVLCVDVDAEKLGAMREIYPPAWRFVVGDAYAAAEDLRARSERVDVVVADAWQSDADRALDALPLWCAVARRCVLVTIPKPWLDERRLAPDAAAVAKWLGERHGTAFRVESLHRRADWSGGVWWLVVRP